MPAQTFEEMVESIQPIPQATFCPSSTEFFSNIGLISVVTLKQLEAFYWAAELGGLEQAAARLNTTQSAISKRLQELESLLGVALFDRSRRKAMITPQGERLLVMAREILDVRDRIMGMSAAITPTLRTLRLGVTELTAMTWLPALVQRIRGSYPGIALEPAVDSSAHLVAKLAQDELDIVVVPDTYRDAQFELMALDSVEYAWMCSPAYLDRTEELSLRELSNHTIIVQLHASGLGDMIGRWLQDNRVKIENTLSSSSLTAIASLTLSGLGISYLPRRIFDNLVSAGQLRLIRSSPPLPRAPYVMMYKKANADDFLRHVASLASDLCDFTRTAPAYFTSR
ncbi:LysR family transcriptional regulator [Paraburkholderia aspalathi]|nr:LysR family transcriptional regulator [Paraburkholderia nemoris]MBK3812866.1 LysR family transcriptional regulator [Paraburkholderia aspalathi]